jgi:hypothetical protein
MGRGMVRGIPRDHSRPGISIFHLCRSGVTIVLLLHKLILKWDLPEYLYHQDRNSFQRISLR